MHSKDAERIMRLPFAHHPQMAQRTRELAADPKITFETAVDALCAEMQTRGITILDLEMCQPGTAFRVPFSPTSLAPEGDFQTSVAGHVRRLLEADR